MMASEKKRETTKPCRVRLNMGWEMMESKGFWVHIYIYIYNYIYICMMLFFFWGGLFFFQKVTLVFEKIHIYIHTIYTGPCSIIDIGYDLSCELSTFSHTPGCDHSPSTPQSCKSAKRKLHLIGINTG